MKKIFSVMLITLMVAANAMFVGVPVFADPAVAVSGSQGNDGVKPPDAGTIADEVPGTVIPETDKDLASCEDVMWFVNANPDTARAMVAGREDLTSQPLYNDASFALVFSYQDILGCGIKTGDIKFWMVPFYVRWVLQFIMGLAGILAVGGIVFGGYLYMFAGLTEDKEKGKAAIKNSIIAFVLVITAWQIVNLVIALVTL